MKKKFFFFFFKIQVHLNYTQNILNCSTQDDERKYRIDRPLDTCL